MFSSTDFILCVLIWGKSKSHRLKRVLLNPTINQIRENPGSEISMEIAPSSRKKFKSGAFA
jgi:hypothetical protein